MSRFKRFMNDYEWCAFDILCGALSETDIAVYPKVRIADVVDINQSMISDELYTYALKAHFDFILIQKNKLVLAIEYDGPWHAFKPTVIENDKLKAQICARFDIPLIRVDGHFLRPIADFRLLAWIIKVWLEKRYLLPHFETETNFRERQYIGNVIFREDLSLNVSGDEKEHEQNTEWSGADELFSCFSYRRDLDPFCDQRYFVVADLRDRFEVESLSGRDRLGFLVAAEILWLDAKTAIVGRGRCQPNRYLPVCEQSITQDLAMIDLYDKFRAFEKGDTRVIDFARAKKLKQSFKDGAYEGCSSEFIGVDHYVFEQWQLSG